MIKISKNLEDKYENYYGRYEELINMRFEYSPEFFDSLVKGSKIIIDSDDLILPNGLWISSDSIYKIEQLGGVTLKVLNIGYSAGNRFVDLGVRSFNSTKDSQ